MSHSATELAAPGRSPNWKWLVCGLLLLATMLNYMDRQTLSQSSSEICAQYRLSNEQYGNLGFVFGLAFAVGSLAWGAAADRYSVRWLYPAALAGWSLAGIATAHSASLGRALHPLLVDLFGPDLWWLGQDAKSDPAYLGLLSCRTMLGIFESGQWPCALVASQRILSAGERTLGNSILQSGASLGAIMTPLVVQAIATPEPEGWRGPFIVIGVGGLLWIVPWLLTIRRGDLDRPAGTNTVEMSANVNVSRRAALMDQLPRFAALVVTVIAINLNWQFLRDWLPKFLKDSHGYSPATANYFTSAYYISADIGCLAAGGASRWLVARRWPVHHSRMATFTACAALAGLSTVAAHLERGPLLLVLLLAIGFGSLGVFPAFYSLSQELSHRKVGKITGVLAAATWVCTAAMEKIVGREIDATHSYARAIFWLGLAPALACAVLWLFWNIRRVRS